MTTVRERVVTSTDVIDNAVTVIDNSTIVSIEASTEDLATTSGELILPGIVGMHGHGGGVAPFTADDEQGVVMAAVHHLAHGTTTLIAGAVTDTPEAMTATISCLVAAAQGAVAGIHIEGPFPCAQRRGAQDPAQMQRPDVALAAATGLPDGNFMLGPQQVTVRDGVATLTHGASLAGGTSRMIDLVRRQVGAGPSLAEVVRAASHTPARVIGVQARVSGLIPGSRADRVVTDADLHPQRVMRAGEWVA